MWRWVILLLAGAYFLIPLYAALRFAGLKAFPDIFKQSGFGSAIALSLRLAVITTVLTLVLMVPTAVYVHLRLPQVRRMMEAITILPIVIPPIVLIIGVLKVAPGFLLGTPYLLALVYVILAMPFAYRSLDAGLRAFDLKTMVEASNSLGRRLADHAVAGGAAEHPDRDAVGHRADGRTGARRVHHGQPGPVQTFPVWIVQFEQNSGPVSVAASLLALFVTWILLMLIVTIGGRGRASAAAPRWHCSPSPRRLSQTMGEPE